MFEPMSPAANSVTTAEQAAAFGLARKKSLEERSRKPAIPSARKRSTHLATVFDVMLNRRAASAFESGILSWRASIVSSTFRR